MLSVTASAFAVEAEIGGLWYEVVSKTKEAKVIKYKNSVKYSGNIVIPVSDYIGVGNIILTGTVEGKKE